jgi:hypothetical protein
MRDRLESRKVMKDAKTLTRLNITRNNLTQDRQERADKRPPRVGDILVEGRQQKHDER